MSGLIEFCVELRSVGESAAAGTDGEVTPSQEPTGQETNEKTRERRQGKLRRQSSVVCSRVHSLSTISYVDDGEGLKLCSRVIPINFYHLQQKAHFNLPLLFQEKRLNV